jgi:hypothetical protein
MGGCSDDGFIDFRNWLVKSGKKVCLAALENPDGLCDEFAKIPDGDIPSWDEDILEKTYENRFGEEMELGEDKYDDDNDIDMNIDLEWDEDDEESLKSICPNTFKKWWGNERF